MWTRRHSLRALGASLATPLALAPAASRAQFRVEIAGVGATQIPIALGRFRDEEKFPQAVSLIVRADLERSGLFRIVDSAPVPQDEAGRPDFAALRAARVDAVLSGSVSRLADGRLDVRYKLWDALKAAEASAMSLPAAPADLRLSAHRVADQVYEKLTGEKGVFATRIAYVTRAPGRYTLRVTDADGEGGGLVLASAEPIISPAWAPDGKSLAYVSFESRKAVVWVQDLATGARKVVANFKGSNSAPAFSPDGRDLAVTLSKDGGSQIYLVARDGSNVRRLTQSSAIDTEPVFAPDGRSLFFVSDRGGGPQVYRQALDGRNAERVTFSGAYNISPALSPDGKQLTYISRSGNAFRTMVMDLAGGEPRVVSDTSDDESPSFAPNGRLIIYATRAEGRDVLMTTTADGRIKSRLLVSGLDIREPTWGPYGR